MRPDEVDLFGLPTQLEAKPRLSPLGPTPEQEGEELIRRYEERYGKDIPPPSAIPVEPTLREQIEQQIAGVLSDDEHRGLRKAKDIVSLLDFVPGPDVALGLVDVFDAETPTEAGIIGAATLFGMTPPGKVVKNVKPPKKMTVFAPRGNENLYSPSEEAALNLKMSKGSGQAFINALIKQGAKPQELKDLGVYDKFQNVKSVTLKEVQDFIAKPSMLDGRNINVITLKDPPNWDGTYDDPDFMKFHLETMRYDGELDNYNRAEGMLKITREAEQIARNKRLARQDLALELRDTDEDIFEPVVDESEGSFNLLDDVDVALNEELIYSDGREYDKEFLEAAGEDGKKILKMLDEGRSPVGALQRYIEEQKDRSAGAYQDYLLENFNEPLFRGTTLRGRKEDYEESILELEPDSELSLKLDVLRGELDKLTQRQYSEAVDDALVRPNSRKTKRREAETAYAEDLERQIAELSPRAMELNSPAEHFGNYSDSVLSHLRTSIRRDDDGNKVFFIDELQSDEHQYVAKEARRLGISRDEIIQTPELKRNALRLERMTLLEGSKLQGLDETVKYLSRKSTILTERVDGRLVTPEFPKQPNEKSVFQFENDPDYNPLNDPDLFDYDQKEIDFDRLKNPPQPPAMKDRTFESKEEALEFFFDVEDQANESATKLDELTKQRDEAQKQFNQRQMDAPFATTDPSAWYSLTLKKAIQKAVESGADKIMLPNGRDIAVLADKGKYLSSIKLERLRVPNQRGSGDPLGEREVFTLVGYDKNGQIAFKKDNLSSDDVDFLIPTIGKDQAKLLLDAPEKDLGFGESRRTIDSYSQGSDSPELFFGGEGMIEYYDRVYPNALKKIVKPFGGKLERMKLRDGETGMGITITDELRKAAEEGFPLYAQGGEVKSAANDVDIFGYNLGGSVGQYFDEQMQPIMQPEQPAPINISPAQLANISGGFATGSGIADIFGEYFAYPTDPEMTVAEMAVGPRGPSLMENIRNREFLDAGLQLAGGIGDIFPPAMAVVGPMRAARAASKAEKIAELRKEANRNRFGDQIDELNERIKRAEELGFDMTPEGRLYHASKQDIYRLKPGYDDGLIFTTPDPAFANFWVGKGKFKERRGIEAEKDLENLTKYQRDLRREIFFGKNNTDESWTKLKGKEYNDEYDRRLRLFRKAIGKDISPDQMHAAVYPLVSRTKKPFVPHKDVDVLEEFFGSEKMSEPFSPATNMPTYRDGLKSGNYILYENKKMVDFLKSKGYDSMFLRESVHDKAEKILEKPQDVPYETFAVFDPQDLRSPFAKFETGDVDTSYRMEYHKPYKGSDDEAVRLDDLTKSISGEKAGYPDNFYTAQGKRDYAPGPAFDGDFYGKANNESYAIIKSARGNPEKEVTIYRAVPKGVKNINEGDFVTLSPTYAKSHAESGYGDRGADSGDVISRKVRVKDLIWDQNDPNEFGFFPDEKDYPDILKAKGGSVAAPYVDIFD